MNMHMQNDDRADSLADRVKRNARSNDERRRRKRSDRKNDKKRAWEGRRNMYEHRAYFNRWPCRSSSVRICPRFSIYRKNHAEQEVTFLLDSFFFLFFVFFFVFCFFFGINFQSLSSPRLSLFYRCYITDSCNIECNAAWATKSTIWIPISCHFLISAWKVRTMHGKFPSGLTAKRRLETPRYRPRIIAFVYRLLEPRVFHISRRNRRNGIDTDIYFAYEILLGVLCCEYTFFRITRITCVLRIVLHCVYRVLRILWIFIFL